MQQQPFPPFNEFIASLKSSNIYSNKNKDRHDLYSIKKYIIELYEGVSAEHSFLDEYNQVWDCIPIQSQPTLIRYRLKLAEPDDIIDLFRDENQKSDKATSNYDGNKIDIYGNRMQCPAGTIPMKRVRVDDVISAGSLHAFLHKKSVQFGKSKKATAFKVRREYAFGAHRMSNRGGASFLNIWQPRVKTGQYLSLSQIWVIGVTPTNRQTVECGWQVAPRLYANDNRPYLFVYWTPDDYKTGYYNLTGPGFVQTNSKWMVGYPFQYVSKEDGPQYDISMAWYQRPDGNWWLYINGNKKEDAVGYYPREIFENGQMSKFANEIKFGGEVTGDTSLPPMGSGQRADLGFKRAAYQRNVVVFNMDRTFDDATLEPVESTPDRYSILVGDDSKWRTFFYFGGR